MGESERDSQSEVRKRRPVAYSFGFFTAFFRLVSLAMNATNGLIRLGATTSWGVRHMHVHKGGPLF